MAKLIEQTLVITVSKLVRNTDEQSQLPLTQENLTEIASVVEALAGEGTIVEVERA
jgi:GTP cyclohydrolase I